MRETLRSCFGFTCFKDFRWGSLPACPVRAHASNRDLKNTCKDLLLAVLMAARGAGFAEQATFALCNLPFSFKLLWAPAVDALFTTRFGLGRRKTWIVPSQLAIGAILCILAVRVDALFGAPPEAHGGIAAPIDAAGLGASFFALYLLCATQDIAVDAVRGRVCGRGLSTPVHHGSPPKKNTHDSVGARAAPS